MVAFSSGNIQGSGIIDTLMKPFTVNKYGNERHSYSLDPQHFMSGYNYVGPHTELQLREQLHDNIPLNKLDAAAKVHDYAYLKEKQEYDKDHNRAKHINNVWIADDRFVRDAETQNDDPIMGNISAKLIRTKENLEKAGMLNTQKFEGFGEIKSDPAARLRQLVQKHVKKTTHTKKNIQDGGFAPLAAIAVTALGALAGKVLTDIYSGVKKKLIGSGMQINHKTNDDKKQFLLELFKHI